MSIRDQNFHKAAAAPTKVLVVPVITAIDLTDTVIYSFTPGFKFQVKGIRSFCRTKAGAVAAVVKIGSRTVASVAITAATEVAATLSTTLANIRGSATEVITIELTTDHTGVLTNGSITLSIRPFPLGAELGPNT